MDKLAMLTNNDYKYWDLFYNDTQVIGSWRFDIKGNARYYRYYKGTDKRYLFAFDDVISNYGWSLKNDTTIVIDGKAMSIKYISHDSLALDYIDIKSKPLHLKSSINQSDK